MTRTSIAVLLALVTLLTAAVVTQAEPVLYTPDKWHTRIYFTVNHMGLSNYGGRFVEYDIRFMFDEEFAGFIDELMSGGEKTRDDYLKQLE